MAQQNAADDVSTELKDAVNSAKGTATPFRSSAPHTKQAADGRWFVKFSTSHGYGRSNALEAARDVLPALEMAYNPHGSTQWLAERGERLERDEAEDLVQEGLVYVNPRGYTARITGFRASGSAEVEYPDSQFGDSHTEPREGRLVDLLVDGICTVLEDPRLATDGGQPMENVLAASSQDEAAAPSQERAQENPHQHTSVLAAAQNLETHEDGSAPRLGVEYQKKNGNGTARKAGTVERVEMERPAEKFGRDVGHAVPRIVFTRDDGQRMYVEPDGLYTVGSHAPYVGATVALTTSTTSTVATPEVAARADDGADSSDDSPQVRTPDVDSLEALAEWVERQDDDLHAEVGSTHYSWDIPGFGRSNDPHSGRTAVRNGNECAYLEVRGPRSDQMEQALAELAHQHDLEVSASSHLATLVPPQGW